MSEIDACKCGDVVVIRLAGDLRNPGVDKLRQRLQEERKKGCHKIVLDVSRVNRADAADLTGLARSLHSLRMVGGKVVLVGASSTVQNSLDRFGVLRWVNRFETEEEGLRFLRSGFASTSESADSHSRGGTGNDQDYKTERE